MLVLKPAVVSGFLKDGLAQVLQEVHCQALAGKHVGPTSYVVRPMDLGPFQGEDAKAVGVPGGVFRRPPGNPSGSGNCPAGHLPAAPQLGHHIRMTVCVRVRVCVRACMQP